MGIIAAFAVPHPPLIVPSVGRGQQAAIQATIDAYRAVAGRIAALKPQTIIVASPHAPLYRDCFFLSAGPTSKGDMGQFGAPQSAIEKQLDQELNAALVEAAQRCAIPLYAPETSQMDHATFVPLHFIEEQYSSYRLVRLGLSGLSSDVHRQWGAVLAQAVRAADRRCVLVASGDLSHKLKADGPYGFAPEGPVFDQRVTQMFKQGDLDGLFDFDQEFCAQAAECGLRSFWVMAGALEGRPCTHELLSYEGPFGVGYAVAAFEPTDDAEKGAGKEGADGKVACKPAEGAAAPAGAETPDPYVALARAGVEHYVTTGQVQDCFPADLPCELLENRAGVFVSLHQHGQLRGCIGTIAPTTESIACEIAQNAASAAARDPRFYPVDADELDSLSYSVDVLMPPEPIPDESWLDPARWGVIVTKGWRRGLLLPNLQGVDTVADQVAIAKQKAGIGIADRDVQLERFEVVRHDRGGQARHE